MKLLGITWGLFLLVGASWAQVGVEGTGLRAAEGRPGPSLKGSIEPRPAAPLSGTIPVTAERANEDREEGAIRERPAFHPDSTEGRKAVQALSVNSSLGDWRPIGPSNFGGKVYSAAVDPLNSNNVYAAYEVGGLWGTHNGGQTWLPMFDGFQDIAFSSVRTHPTVAGLVAAGLIAKGGGYSTSFNQHVGVVLSTDGGNTWKNIGPGSDTTASIWEIGFGDTTGQTIYAPTDKGLYKTTNRGQSWTPILAYSGTEFFDDRPSFAVDPANSSILLLAQRTIGVMRSTNAGSSWTRVDTWVNPGTAAQNPTILAWSTGNPNFVYAEAYVNGAAASLATYASADAGLTWAPTAVTTDFQQGMYDMAIAVDPFNASHVIIHNTNLQYSNDGLKTLIEGTKPGPDCLSVTFDPSAGGVIYDGGDEGVFRSADGGNTWMRFDTGVRTTKTIGGSQLSVGTDGRVYTNAADYNPGQVYVPGIGWVTRGDGYEYTRSFVNPHDPTDTYWVRCCVNATLYRGAFGTGAATLIDPAPAESAQSYYPSGNLAVDFDPVDANTLFEGRQNLYKSTNRGNSWTKIVVSATVAAQSGILLVRVAPSNANHIYIVSSDQIWSTTTGGTSWTPGATISGTRMLAVSPGNENTVFIASDSGLYQSTNSGLTAAPLAGLTGVAVSWVLVDPNTPTQIYAALSNTGVLVSQDNGNSWQQLGSQLPLVQVDWMSAVGGNLYAGTLAGVWEMNLGGQPVCSQKTVNPSGLTVPSTGGTWRFDLFIAGSCSWTATNPVSWATIQTNGVSSGPATLYVTFAGNTTGGGTRTTTLTIAGMSVAVTQASGPDPVTSGSTVTLFNSGGCVTVESDKINLQTAPCTANNPNQQFTLRGSGGGFFAINSVGGTQCIDVYGSSYYSGAYVAEYPCTYGLNEAFTLYSQAGGYWMINGNSQLCLNVAGAGAFQSTCGESTGQLFSIKVLQSITFSAIANQPVGAAPFAITATASSGLLVTFTSNTTSVCTVSGSTVTILISGGCAITASQGGDPTHFAAVPVTQRFTVLFADVAPADFDFTAVNLFAQRGITAGCGNNDFCPDANVTRAQMAIFIVRAIEGGDNFTSSATPYFTDVTSAAFGFKWIQKMKELGITAGCGGGNYCPNDNISRAQMAIFNIRVRLGVNLAGATPSFSYPATPSFTDVAKTDFGFAWIQRMKRDAITSGCTATTYCPNDPVTRGQMAIFILRGAFNQLLPAGTAVLAQVSPSTLAAGTSGTFTITGANTHFVQGTTQLSPLPGVTIGAITVTSSTTLTVQLTAAANATPQPYSILAVTGTEEAVLPNGLAIQ
jgi:hypothetical protein